MPRRRLVHLSLVCAATAVVAIGATFAGAWMSPSRSATGQSEDGVIVARLDGSTVQTDVGTIAAGSRKIVKVVLLNPTGHSISLQPVKTSCECARMELPQHVIAGGEELSAEVAIDFSKQPAFRGNLFLTVECTSTTGTKLFAIQFEVSVR